LFTVRARGEEFEAANPTLPEYTAVNEWAPAANALVLKVATPKEFTFIVPSSVVPSKKLIVPRGEPVGVGDTVPVSVTECPSTAGLGLADNIVRVEVGLGAEMISVSGMDVEFAKLALPE
jgi:hypothetical protein